MQAGTATAASGRCPLSPETNVTRADALASEPRSPAEMPRSDSEMTCPRIELWKSRDEGDMLQLTSFRSAPVFDTDMFYVFLFGEPYCS